MFEDLIDAFLLRQNEGIFLAEEESKKIVYADSLVRSYFGEDLLGRPCYEAMYHRSAPCGCCPLLSETPGPPGCWEMMRKGEPPFMFMVRGSLLRKEGQLYRICKVQDISDYLLLVDDLIDYGKILCEQASGQGELDSLTGLENRNCFARRNAGEYLTQPSWGVIYFDINNMKTTNDQWGHEAGDALLRRAAQSIQALNGENLHRYRIGGDEFLLVAMACQPEELDALLARWRQLATDLTTDSGLPCSIAAGAAWGQPPQALEALIKQADAAMYAEKMQMKSEPR